MRFLTLILVGVVLTACGLSSNSQVVIERIPELCPASQIEPPDCPDFPPHEGKRREVVMDEHDLTLARCRGWANKVWKAIEVCKEEL